MSRHCFRNKNSNVIHPVASFAHSAANLKSSRTTKALIVDNVANSKSFVVKVRVLHGIDLHIPTIATCQHTLRPEVRITVNGSSLQSCIAAQHARNHSIWKTHELEFHVSPRCQDLKQSQFDGTLNEIFAPILMHISLVCSLCPCAAKHQDKMANQIAIGEVGELQLSARHNEGFEITQFFPVIRHQQQKSQSLCVLLPAGKIKLCIRVEAKKGFMDRNVKPTLVPNFLFVDFGEALQLKRKQLKTTVVSKDNLQQESHQQVLQVNSSASAQLQREITVETLLDHVCANNLIIGQQIGEGIHSCVRRGTLHCESDGSDLQVAVKVFRHQHLVPPINVLRAFQQEYRILENCRNQRGHRHIVNLLGVIVEAHPIIVMESLSLGSLAQCLLDEAMWSQMTVLQKATIGLKIARGIAWLHEHNMIHRDIKTHNILIGASLIEPNSVVKIGDLGSAVVTHQHEPRHLEEIGSSGYTAPEIFTHLGYDNKVDVWSFGVVLWELMSSSLKERANPFTGLIGEQLVEKIRNGCRPVFAHAHQLCVRPIVEKCWILDPSQRPNMTEVVEDLETLCNKL